MPDDATTASRLSTREREIAGLVATGKSNRAIAEALHLSDRTVERHVSAVFNKLDVHSRAELIAAVFGGALQTDAPTSPKCASGGSRPVQPEAASEGHPDVSYKLPAQLSTLIGRESTLPAVTALLRAGRLLTIVGTGGVGKTRIALQLASSSVAAYRDGACFVELAPLGDPRLVAPTIAVALVLLC
jgi:DNA-binding CsgD family transcriptional regulator